MVVVQDLFLTETAELADVVLPAAAWGEKLGTFTNVDRTVHLTEQAVDPPGEARADLDIFLDYARRMDFRDRDGGPLITWHDAESAFEAWKSVPPDGPATTPASRTTSCAAATASSGPARAEPDGTERLYTDGQFNTDPDYCETYGQEVTTGRRVTRPEYRREGAAGTGVPPRRGLPAVARGAHRRLSPSG